MENIYLFRGEEYTINACIIVASHISTAIRVNCLCECLNSLLDQTVVIPIILSISFESELVFTIYKMKMEMKNLVNNPNITIIIREHKTAQFRHIFNVFEIVKHKYEYFMFCDDDDTYHINRVYKFINSLLYGLNQVDTRIFAGVCEIDEVYLQDKKTIEYWNYLLCSNIIQEFITKIQVGGFDKFIDNFMFDILFGYYLMLNIGNDIFWLMEIKDKLYNYNIRDDSITGIWNKPMTGLSKFIPQNSIQDYKNDLNSRLKNVLPLLKQNLFYSTSVGNNFDVEKYIIEWLGIESHPIKKQIIQFFEPKLLQELESYYNEVKTMTEYFGIKQRLILCLPMV